MISSSFLTIDFKTTRIVAFADWRIPYTPPIKAAEREKRALPEGSKEAFCEGYLGKLAERHGCKNVDEIIFDTTSYGGGISIAELLMRNPVQ